MFSLGCFRLSLAGNSAADNIALVTLCAAATPQTGAAAWLAGRGHLTPVNSINLQIGAISEALFPQRPSLIREPSFG